MPTITSLLIANRGEIAVRIMRTARAMGIRTVAVFSDPDADLPHVRAADVAVRLPGATPAETYLRADLLVDAARRAGADAVHPGYGFLSENADFARAVEHAGLVWVGPPPAAIAAMGSKLEAKRRMRAAGVPTLASQEVTPGAVVTTNLPYPVLVKASAGGGGRGMRIVRDPAGLAQAVESAAREAASAFGDGTVFLERYAENPRHVEVQVMADVHGHVVHLFERECSIQRRHQKIVEECPSPAVDDDLRARLGEAAVAAARAIGYVGAGTVEFLLLGDGSFAFLEVNTRLQVEHPVTELVTGLDLVRLQVEVAEGQPLPPAARCPTLSGHAIEVRLYAEDPAADWQPQAGRLACFEVPAGVRVDAGVESGSVVGVHYDPMLAKVVAHAPTRAEAARRLATALAGARLHGITTNRDLLVRVLRHPDFVAGRTDTGFLDRIGLHTLAAPLADAATSRLHATAAALCAAAGRRRAAPVLAGLPSGWRNNPSQPQVVRYADATVAYQGTRTGWEVQVDGEPLPLTVVTVQPDRLVADVDGVRRHLDVHQDGETAYVDSDGGSTVHVAQPRFPEPGAQLAPGSLTAAMPGSVVRVEVAVGDHVAAGDTLVVLEAMKMEHPVTAPAAGVVTELPVAPRTQVETGALLAVVAVESAPPAATGR